MAALAALRSPAMLCLCESDACAARKAVVSWCHWIFGEVVKKGARKNKGNAHWDKEEVFFPLMMLIFRVKVQYTSGCVRLLKLPQIQKNPMVDVGHGIPVMHCPHSGSPELLNLSRFRPLQTLSDLPLPFPVRPEVVLAWRMRAAEMALQAVTNLVEVCGNPILSGDFPGKLTCPLLK